MMPGRIRVGLLTVVTKSNAQRHAMVMWDEIAVEVAAEFPDVTWDKMLVDAMTMRIVMKPQTLDTIVATNLHADILSDLAAALAGMLGRPGRAAHDLAKRRIFQVGQPGTVVTLRQEQVP